MEETAYKRFWKNIGFFKERKNTQNLEPTKILLLQYLKDYPKKVAENMDLAPILKSQCRSNTFMAMSLKCECLLLKILYCIDTKKGNTILPHTIFSYTTVPM